jgi:hypothetical protein
MLRSKGNGKVLVLAAPNVPNVTSGMTNLEFTQVLEDVFDSPSPLIADMIQRFANMASKESKENEIEGQTVPIQCKCPVCGSALDLTLK